MHMQDVATVLQSLGLLDSEIKTYFASLDSGALTVLEITKKTALSRQAVYVAIDGLTKRGLVSSVLQGKKRLFISEDPKKLIDYAKRREVEIKEKIKELETVLPKLDLRANIEKPIVRVFEGKEGLHAITKEVIKSKEKYHAEIVDTDAMYKVLTTDDLKILREEWEKLGAKLQGINAGEIHSKKRDGTSRYGLPKEYWGFKSNIGVYGDKVVMVTFEGQMHSVIIDSRPLTQAMKVLFELAMKAAKNLPEIK